MLVPVTIDLSGVIDEFILSEQESKALSRFVLSNIADEYMRYWENNINNSLHSTRSEYKQAIFFEQTDDFSVLFGMSPRKSKVALMLEEGASEFDMKDGFNKSSKKTQKAGGGWFLTIPFRHATSEALAESMVFSGQMPKEIEKLVKVTGKPLNLADLPTNYQGRKTSWAGYTHKAAIYEGLKREDISSTNKERRGGYYTFRRVSDKSESNSWKHPGFEALKLMEKSLGDLPFDKVVDRSVDQFLQTKFLD